MARTPYPRSDRDLMARIGRSAGGKAGYKQLVRELGLGGGRERRLLLEQLTRMVARGDLARAGDEMWSLPKREPVAASPSGRWNGFEAVVRGGRDRLVSGRLDLHRDGFGFVRPEAKAGGPESRDSDIFIPPNEINGAMQGDLVLVDELPPGRDGRRSGRVARVLTRRNPTVVGIFHYARPQARRGGDLMVHGNYVVPLDERVGGAILIAEGDEVVAAGVSVHRTLGEEAYRGLKPTLVADMRPDPEGSGYPIVSSEKEVPSTGSRQALRSAQDDRFKEGDDKFKKEGELEGMAVDVEITAFPTAGRPARGRVIEVLGPPDAFGVDVEIVIRKHHIPHTFPAAVLAEAAASAELTVATLDAEELARREDFRGLPTVTIDGETARDFDDAVLVRPLANGNTELQVHIADVSWYVRPGSALDTEARMRGTSVYFPDRAVPMLPHALSSGMCSLLPHEDRLVLSCVMEIDAAGEVVGYRVAEGVIRSVRRCTYTSVQRCLDAGASRQGVGSRVQGSESKSDISSAEGMKGHGSETPSGPWALDPKPSAEDIVERERVMAEQPELVGAFDAMLELALRLNAKRVRRGSIDFDLPEPVVEFDPDGNMKAIVRSERGWAHRLIEEFMLSANECVATWLEQQGIASIYRIHEMPDPKRIVDFEETAAGFGYSLGLGTLPVKKFTMKADRRDSRQRSARGRDSRAVQGHEVPESIPVTPQMYQRLVRRISGTAEERILAYLMLRSLKQARYAEGNVGHFALASPSYTHFTSPIRRYPDLIVHRLVRAMLRGGADATGGAIRSDDAQPWGEARGQGLGSRAQKANDERQRHSEPWALSPGPLSAEELNDIAVESSQAERRSADAERELIEWKKMRFMEDKVGDDFEAVVLSCTKYGFFVELNDMFIEGLVPMGSLAGDFYSFRDTDRTIVGSRTGHVFSLGQKVHVILDRIDRQQRRLQFALLPGTEPKANTGVGSIRSGTSEAKKAKGAAKKVSGKAKARQRKKR